MQNCVTVKARCWNRNEAFHLVSACRFQLCLEHMTYLCSHVALHCSEHVVDTHCWSMLTSKLLPRRSPRRMLGTMRSPLGPAKPRQSMCQSASSSASWYLLGLPAEVVVLVIAAVVAVVDAVELTRAKVLSLLARGLPLTPGAAEGALDDTSWLLAPARSGLEGEDVNWLLAVTNEALVVTLRGGLLHGVALLLHTLSSRGVSWGSAAAMAVNPSNNLAVAVGSSDACCVDSGLAVAPAATPLLLLHSS